MANRTQQNPVASSDEWYTPRWVIDELGPFDLDPCAPMQPPYEIAPLSFNKEQDGLSQTWPDTAVVFMNPPYSRPLLRPFVEKLAKHGNGIALLKNQVDNLLFQEVIFTKAASMLFMRHRIKFITSEGVPVRRSLVLYSLLLAMSVTVAFVSVRLKANMWC